MSEKMGLDAMTGWFLSILGSAAVEVRRGEDGAMWFRMANPPTGTLREATHGFLKEYNAYYGTSFAASFPKNYRMTLREGPRSPRRTDSPGATGRGSNRGRAR